MDIMRKVAVASIIVILAALLAGCAGGGEADKTPPVISVVSASNITETSATITWATNEPSHSQVYYGLTTNYGRSISTFHTQLVTQHTINLTGLDPDTTYHYCVESRDASGNEATSEDDTFTTLPPPPTNVQITHIFYDGLVYRVESDEYVEVTNVGDAPQDLEGWMLMDISEGYPSFTFPSYILAPGASTRVYTNEIHPEWGGFSFRYGKAIWNNSDPDIAALYDADGREVSRKSYLTDS